MLVAVYRTLKASGGNAAIWSFYGVAGAYAGVTTEAVLGIVQMLEDSIAHRFETKASTRMI